MNGGQRGKILSAKDLTAEIDRATDAVVANDSVERRTETGFPGDSMNGAQKVNSMGIASERAQALGKGAIFSSGAGSVANAGYETNDEHGANEGFGVNGERETPEEMTFGQVENTGEASVEAAAELSEVENEMANPEAFVGLASGVEAEEHARQDWETAENEADPRRSRIAEIEYRNQEAVAKGVAPEVEKMLHEKSFELAGLLELYREGRNKTLDVVNHPIGKDN